MSIPVTFGIYFHPIYDLCLYCVYIHKITNFKKKYTKMKILLKKQFTQKDHK